MANNIARRVGADVQRRIDALKIEQKMQDLPEELWHDSFKFYVKHDPDRKGGPNLRMIRLAPDKPSLVSSNGFRKQPMSKPLQQSNRLTVVIYSVSRCPEKSEN